MSIVHHPLPLPTALTRLDRTLVMGVVNVTPGLLLDGGRWFDPAAPSSTGDELLAQGADILDVGGESTRPGARAGAADEERRAWCPWCAASRRPGPW